MKFDTNRLLGFTLIELIITLFVASILAAIAAPSFIDTIRNSRVTTQANNLVSSLQLARSEAVKRGIQVTVRHNGTVSSNWDDGWSVFVDWDGDGVFDDNGTDPECDVEEDCLLRFQAELPSNLTLRTGGSFTQWVAYLPSGFPSSSAGLGNDTFRLCSPAGDETNSRAIVINNTGRPSTEVGTNSCP